jgi:hypothetical protein
MHQLGSPLLHHTSKASTKYPPDKDPLLQRKHWLGYPTPREQSLSLHPGGPFTSVINVRLSFPAFIRIAALAKSHQYFFGIALVTFEYERIKAVEFPRRAAIFRQLETLHTGAGSNF